MKNATVIVNSSTDMQTYLKLRIKNYVLNYVFHLVYYFINIIPLKAYIKKLSIKNHFNIYIGGCGIFIRQVYYIKNHINIYIKSRYIMYQLNKLLDKGT